jgi:hypothetical protein
MGKTGLWVTEVADRLAVGAIAQVDPALAVTEAADTAATGDQELIQPALGVTEANDTLAATVHPTTASALQYPGQNTFLNISKYVLEHIPTPSNHPF